METLNVVCPECTALNTIKIEIGTERYPCLQCQADLDDPFPTEVTDASCATHIKQSDIPLLLDFYSTSCGPCMAMYDDYEDAALYFTLKVRFLKINADKHQEIAREYGVSALPTLIAFKNSEEVNRISRQLSEVELKVWAESLII